MGAQHIMRWIEAGQILVKDSDAIVTCPVCQEDVLQVEDVRSDVASPVLERHMTCPSCQAHNLLRLWRPSSMTNF
jgi:hypothetical protein